MPQTFTIPDYIRHEAEAQGLDPAIALGIAEKESSFNPSAMGPEFDQGGQRVRAIGTFQLLPDTAKMLGVDPHDPQQNIQGGIKYLKQLLEQHGDPYKALGAYGGVKTDTTYVPDALARIKKYQLQGGGTTTQTQTGPPPKMPPGVSVVPAGEGGISAIPATDRGQAQGFDEQHPWLAKLADILHPANEEVVDALQGVPTPVGASPAEALRRSAERGTVKFAQEATTSLNPINIAKGVGSLLTTSPLDTLRNMAEAHRRVWDEGQALEDMGQGIAGRLRKSESVIPLFGPRIADIDKYAREGEYARAAGAATDVAGQVVGPKFLEGSRVAPRVFRPRLNPVQQAAVDFGMQDPRLSMDVATVSGSPFALKLQRMTEATPAGSPVAERVALNRGAVLPTTLEEVARGVHPTPVMPEQAGAGLRSGTEDYIAQRHGEANVAYDTQRQIEAAAPVQQVQVGTTNQWTPQGTLQQVPVMGPMRLPADLSAAKAILRPIAARFDQLIGTAQQGASPGLRAIKQILDGPDFMSASELDANLSAIKGLGRGADMPQLRNVSQGLAAKATEALEQAHDAAITQAGPQMQQAVLDGRLATKAKYAAQDVLDKLKTEPVQSFRGATLAKDAGIEHLRDLARVAPQEIPKVARAVLEDLFSSGTAEGGWKGATGLEARWSKLGPATKQLLFGSTAADLDKFFLLGKMLERTPNASGTALTLSGVGSLTAAVFHPTTGIPALLAAGWVAKLMNSRTGIRLLTQGLTIPAGTAQAAAWGAAINEQLQKAGERVALPPPLPPGRAPANAPPPPR